MPQSSTAVTVRDGRPTLNNDQDGVEVPNPTPAQAELMETAKNVVSVLVAAATVGVATLPQHTIGFQVSVAIVGLGAALGIRSRGVQPRPKKSRRT